MAGELIGGVAQSWTVLGWPRKCAQSLKHFKMIFKGFLSHYCVLNEDLITCLLAGDAKKRPEAEEVLKHAWLLKAN